MKELETTKLWYNRYLYKVVMRNKLGYHIGWGNRYILRSWTVDEDMEDLYALIKDRDVKTRGEGAYISVFTNETSLVKKLHERFGKDIEEIWEPDPEREHLLKNANTIIVKEKPSYPIKVTMNDRRMSGDFAKWIDANSDKIKIGDAAFRAVKRGWMTGGLYFYLRDDKVLSLINLLIPDNIRRIDKLVCE